MASQGTVKRSTLGSVGVSLSWPNLVSQTLSVLESSPPTLSGANLTSALALGQNVRKLRKVTCHSSLSMTVLSESMLKMPYPRLRCYTYEVTVTVVACTTQANYKFQDGEEEVSTEPHP